MDVIVDDEEVDVDKTEAGDNMALGDINQSWLRPTPSDRTVPTLLSTPFLIDQTYPHIMRSPLLQIAFNSLPLQVPQKLVCYNDSGI
jgi:hypothetical protein